MRALRKPGAFVLLAILFGVSPISAQTPPPSLVVVISVDQMRADYLDRFRPWFGKDGFNRFLERGAVWPEARHRHAATFTCPGHASIGSGLDPRHSGIVANRWYDVVAGAGVYCVEDRRASWVGAGENPPRTTAQPASPVQMTGDSLGDRLKEKYPGARVVGVALKDRAAVLMAGRKADAAIWFEEKFERFVTSTYYPPRPPLLAIDDALPAFFADPAHREWKLSGRIPKADLERLTVAPVEGWTGQPASYGPAFPHTLPKPYDIVHSPWGDELVLDLARHAVSDFGLGTAADHPDLLFVGLSSTDYYGHWFGPDSREIADGIVLLDERLERFFHWLDERVGKDRVLLFLTADHGVQAIPQVARARAREKTGREDPSAAGRVDLSNGRDTGELPLVRELSRTGSSSRSSSRRSSDTRWTSPRARPPKPRSSSSRSRASTSIAASWPGAESTPRRSRPPSGTGSASARAWARPGRTPRSPTDSRRRLRTASRSSAASGRTAPATCTSS